MDEPFLLIDRDRDDGIVRLTLDRPAARNPISETGMIDALTDAPAELERHPETRVIILTGAGPAFSAGGNLKTMGKGGSLGGGAPESWNARLPQVLELSAAMQALAHSTRDHREAFAAMIDRRPPTFEGR